MNIYETLKLYIPEAKLVSGGREILVRCRYCPDSSNPNHAHMYISTGYNNEPVFFYCQKCGATGLVTNNRLIEWGIYDINLGVNIIKYNDNSLKLEKNKRFRDNVVYRINNSLISDNKLSEVKLRYINNRLGLNLTYKDLLDNKIVLNLKDLLYNNNITKYTRNENIIEELNNYFLGFISVDNAFINMRNLCIDKTYLKKRYINYNTFGKYDTTQRFYVIPSNLNIADPNPIRLCIAEGPFDILSIKYNLYTDYYNTIFAAICGSSYMNIIKYFMINLGLVNLEIHIYADNDVKDYVINNIYNQLYILKSEMFKVYIHRNVYPNEKDMGVKRDHIIDSVQLLL